MTEFLIKLLGDSAEQWRNESYEAFNKAGDYVIRISNEFGDKTDFQESAE